MTDVRCSDVHAEPLPGSAKQESVYVLLEHPSGWSHDILDGDTFGPELTAALKAKLDGVAGLQLIRHPGREGRKATRKHLYLVFARHGIAEQLFVNGPEDILTLDLTGPGNNNAKCIDHPLVLVCTHGKRDVCCAIKGRPLVKELAETFAESDMIWETSHTKGHRFAPSILLMPWGYSFGRLNPSAATAMVNSARAGRYFYPGNRGRGIYAPQEQVAELAVARMLIDAHEPLSYSDLIAHGTHVTHHDGRSWDVELEEVTIDGIVSSCDKPATTGTIWQAHRVSEC